MAPLATGVQTDIHRCYLKRAPLKQQRIGANTKLPLDPFASPRHSGNKNSSN